MAKVDPIKVILRAFPGISRSEASEMVAVGKVKKYAEGINLCQEGEIENIFYILLQGDVKVTKAINEEEDRYVSTLKPGDFFGEMALIHDAPRSATVTSLGPISVLEIHRDSFEDLVRYNSSFSVAMVREVSRRLRENNDLAVEDLRMKAGELAAAYQQLAELEYARSEFLSVVAHELRTPLTIANGFLQVIRAHQLQGQALDSALDTIAGNLQQIISLTNDILFLQEMDFILPEFEPTDIGAVVAGVVETVRGLAERSKIGIDLKIVPDLPTVPADGKSLERAFAAILDNSIKFSPDGGDVNVQVDFNQQQVWVKVDDHGVGIPPEAQERVFDRFYHLEEVNGHLFRGVGLGLSIARQVIEQHHGHIQLQSELGKGSTFTIWLNRSSITA